MTPQEIFGIWLEHYDIVDPDAFLAVGVYEEVVISAADCMPGCAKLPNNLAIVHVSAPLLNEL